MDLWMDKKDGWMNKIDGWIGWMDGWIRRMDGWIRWKHSKKYYITFVFWITVLHVHLVNIQVFSNKEENNFVWTCSP